MRQRILIIDGYNLLFKMKVYKKIKSNSFSIERDILIDILKEYASGNEYDNVFLIFDAYQTRTKEFIKIDFPINIVYTKTGTTADEWIEKKTRELFVKDFVNIIVISDDNDERISTLGYGAIIRDCDRFIKDLYERKIFVNKLAIQNNYNKFKNRYFRISEDDEKKLYNFLMNGKNFMKED